MGGKVNREFRIIQKLVKRGINCTRRKNRKMYNKDIESWYKCYEKEKK